MATYRIHEVIQQAGYGQCAPSWAGQTLTPEEREHILREARAEFDRWTRHAQSRYVNPLDTGAEPARLVNEVVAELMGVHRAQTPPQRAEDRGQEVREATTEHRLASPVAEVSAVLGELMNVPARRRR